MKISPLLGGVIAAVLFMLWLFTAPPCTDRDVGNLGQRACISGD